MRNLAISKSCTDNMGRSFKSDHNQSVFLEVSTSLRAEIFLKGNTSLRAEIFLEVSASL